MKNYLSPNAEFADSSLMPDKMLIFKLVNLKDFLYLRKMARLCYSIWVRWSPSGAGAEQGQQDRPPNGAACDKD